MHAQEAQFGWLAGIELLISLIGLGMGIYSTVQTAQTAAQPPTGAGVTDEDGRRTRMAVEELVRLAQKPTVDDSLPITIGTEPVLPAHAVTYAYRRSGRFGHFSILERDQLINREHVYRVVPDGRLAYLGVAGNDERLWKNTWVHRIVGRQAVRNDELQDALRTKGRTVNSNRVVRLLDEEVIVVRRVSTPTPASTTTVSGRRIFSSGSEKTTVVTEDLWVSASDIVRIADAGVNGCWRGLINSDSEPGELTRIGMSLPQLCMMLVNTGIRPDQVPAYITRDTLLSGVNHVVCNTNLDDRFMYSADDNLPIIVGSVGF